MTVGPHPQRPCLFQPEGFPHGDLGFTKAAPLQVSTDLLLVVDDGPSLLRVEVNVGRNMFEVINLILVGK